MNPFSIEYVFFQLGGYPVSLIELIGSLAGLVSVWWAARANILTWPMGTINCIAFGVLFYQARLYSDMFLQLFFLGFTVYGWRSWHTRREETAQGIHVLSMPGRLIGISLVGLLVLLWGYLISRIHLIWPGLFPEPAALPYTDAFISMMSIAATILLGRKVLESWLCWIFVDMVSIYAYFKKDLAVVGFEYVVFLGMAIFGWLNWWKLYRLQPGKK
jgi:nicotinamide mononucleotide transporter